MIKTKPPAYVSLMDASNQLITFIRSIEQPYSSIECFMLHVNNLEKAIQEASKLHQGEKFISRELKRIFVHSFKYKCRHLSTHLIKAYAKYYIPLQELCAGKRILHQSDFFTFIKLIKDAFGEKGFYQFRNLCFQYRGYILQSYNAGNINDFFGAANIDLPRSGGKYKNLVFNPDSHGRYFTANFMPYFCAPKQMFFNIAMKLLHLGFQVNVSFFQFNMYITEDQMFQSKNKLLSAKLIWQMYDRFEEKTPECAMLMVIYYAERKMSYDEDVYHLIYNSSNLLTF